MRFGLSASGGVSLPIPQTGVENLAATLAQKADSNAVLGALRIETSSTGYLVREYRRTRVVYRGTAQGTCTVRTRASLVGEGLTPYEPGDMQRITNESNYLYVISPMTGVAISGLNGSNHANDLTLYPGESVELLCTAENGWNIAHVDSGHPLGRNALLPITSATMFDAFRGRGPVGAKCILMETDGTQATGGQIGDIIELGAKSGGLHTWSKVGSVLESSEWQNCEDVAGMMQNSWVSHSEQYKLKFRKKAGLLMMTGIAKSGTDNPIMILPEGFRPPSTMILYTQISGNVLKRMDVSNDGSVSVTNYSTSWTSMSFVVPIA